jgi:hypothetical protein
MLAFISFESLKLMYINMYREATSNKGQRANQNVSWEQRKSIKHQEVGPLPEVDITHLDVKHFDME